MNYAHGFIFNDDMSQVAIIGDAQQNKDERRPRDTMSRFYKEKCGVECDPDKWTMFAELLKPDKEEGVRHVYFFTVIPDLYDVRERASYVHGEFDDPIHRFLVPLAINWHALGLDIVILMHESNRARRRK